MHRHLLATLNRNSGSKVFQGLESVHQRKIRVNKDFHVMQHHGSTDPMVILNTLEYYGIPQEVTSFPLLSEQYVLLQVYMCEVKICSAWKSMSSFVQQ